MSTTSPPGLRCSFPDFSTWRGRPGLYLEDLYVREWARGRGVGRRLMARLAAIAIERDWPALDFKVLDWNPARGFYHRLGIEARSRLAALRCDRRRRSAASPREDVGDGD